MPKEDMIEVKATLAETLPHSTFGVKCDTDQTIIAHLAGRTRIWNIRIMTGELVFPFDIATLSHSRSLKK
jgi:translation initiation factor IF-1